MRRSRIRPALLETLEHRRLAAGLPGDPSDFGLFVPTPPPVLIGPVSVEPEPWAPEPFPPPENGPGLLAFSNALAPGNPIPLVLVSLPIPVPAPVIGLDTGPIENYGMFYTQPADSPLD